MSTPSPDPSRSAGHAANAPQPSGGPVQAGAERTPVEERLAALGITLPEPAKPVAAYIPAKLVGSLLYISGQIPVRDGKLIAAGRVPSEVSPEQARECMRQCVLNGLAAAKAALGSLDRIAHVVRVGAWIASDAAFTEQPRVANGASELLVEVFGDRGRHVRAAVGTNVLPLGAPVEVEFLFQLAGAECP